MGGLSPPELANASVEKIFKIREELALQRAGIG
jgi:hypothetical protein